MRQWNRKTTTKIKTLDEMFLKITLNVTTLKDIGGDGEPQHETIFITCNPKSDPHPRYMKDSRKQTRKQNHSIEKHVELFEQYLKKKKGKRNQSKWPEKFMEKGSIPLTIMNMKIKPHGEAGAGPAGWPSCTSPWTGAAEAPGRAPRC